MANAGNERHVCAVPGTVDEALGAVGEAADLWGGSWSRLGMAGRLELPVSAGLRYGMLAGEVAASPGDATTDLELTVEEAAYRVHLPALSVIVFGAIGAVTMILAPLFPGLFALVPVGFIIMICSWFLVLSRLQHKGPREFVALVEEIARETHGAQIDDRPPSGPEQVGRI
ncbi:MAG: hypothetical protein AAGA81_10265 [Acidobacteriota bacterium]